MLVLSSKLRSEFVQTSNETTPHAAEIVSSNETTLLGGVSDLAIDTYVGHFDEARRAADSAKDALVVAFINQGDGTEQIEKEHEKLSRHMAPELRARHLEGGD